MNEKLIVILAELRHYLWEARQSPSFLGSATRPAQSGDHHRLHERIAIVAAIDPARMQMGHGRSHLFDLGQYLLADRNSSFR